MRNERSHFPFRKLKACKELSPGKKFGVKGNESAHFAIDSGVALPVAWIDLVSAKMT